MSNPHLGRHRAPGRLNPASSLSAAVSRAAKPATKVSAVLAVSGGMVASFNLPASASPLTTEVTTDALAGTSAPLAPLAAPAPLVSRTFGKIPFTGVVKPRPVAAPVVTQGTIDRVSRYVTREPVLPLSGAVHGAPVAAPAPTSAVSPSVATGVGRSVTYEAASPESGAVHGAPVAAPAPTSAVSPSVATRVRRSVTRKAASPVPRVHRAPVAASAPTSAVSPSVATRVRRSASRKPASHASKVTHKAPVVAPIRSSRSGVLDFAARLAGISYVWGGTTLAGFDCSGYTQYVFRKIGVHLPRVAEDQRRATTRVSRANARPGDLVFFGAPAHHVGIYAGDGMMWDSPRTGKAISKRLIWSSSATFGRV